MANIIVNGQKRPFVEAMGADHIKQARLRQIVDMMNHAYSNLHNGHKNMSAAEHIIDTYDIAVDTRNYNFTADMPYVTEEKYDGFSYLNSYGRFFSKRLSAAKGSEGMPIEKTGHLPHITAVMHNAFEIGGCDFQGEVYIKGGISDDITRIMGCDEEKAAARCLETINNGNPVRYMLIDIRSFMGRDVTHEPYHIRRVLLEYAYDRFIVPFDTGRYVGVAELLPGDPRAHFSRIVNSGGEGIIIKNTESRYYEGKKPAGIWIKGKKKITVDVVITGFNPGTGKNSDKFGSFRFGLWSDGKIIECGNCSSGLADNIRDMVAANPDSYIGHVMEIEAIQESVKSFRNAVFLRLRDDKSTEECTPDSVKVKDVLI